MASALEITQELVRCPSVTPQDCGAIEVVESHLKRLGFKCERLPFVGDDGPDTLNLFATFGSGTPHLCFAGHTDVVPAAPETHWTHPPFNAHIHNNILFGRGTCDMKGGIACFIEATDRLLQTGKLNGTLSFLITGDEEGTGINGTEKMVAWAQEKGIHFDACIVGEATNPETVGEMIKIGRRGSLHCTITSKGKLGHVAYPHIAQNPTHPLIDFLHKLTQWEIDQGTDDFQPSNLEITTIDVGNPAQNVIPETASAHLNIRFNVLHTAQSLEHAIRHMAATVSPELHLKFSCNAHPFLCEDRLLPTLMSGAIKAVTHITPALSTSGGTSDARFIKDLCPTVEFGLVNKTIHAVDEQVPLSDLETLTRIYAKFLEDFFSTPR